jgi:hypothetical protein
VSGRLVLPSLKEKGCATDAVMIFIKLVLNQIAVTQSCCHLDYRDNEFKLYLNTEKLQKHHHKKFHSENWILQIFMNCGNEDRPILENSE